MKLQHDRETRETTIRLDLATGTEPQVDIAWESHGGMDEGIEPAMATHLYHTLLAYARLGGTLEAGGDLAHHVVEDTGIALGTALGEHAANAPIVRFAQETIAMDEALVQVVLDAGGRPFYASDLAEASHLWDHALRSLAFEAKFTLHVRVLRGHDPHHIVEATLKATGRCLATALEPSDRLESTKGHVKE